MSPLARLTAFLVLGLLAPLIVEHPAYGRAEIKLGEHSSIDLGLRLQSELVFSERDLTGDGDFENTTEVKIRRLRLRVGATATSWLRGFIQTGIGGPGGGLGRDSRILEAYAHIKPLSAAQLYVGIHMAPAARQNLTTAAALLAIDRPAINFKTLTWGGRALTSFSNRTFAASDSGLRGDVDVRDTGLTLFGTLSPIEWLHLKYYAGVYDGVQASNSAKKRVTARLQVNLFEPELGYFNLSTYIGRKRTVSLGASFDTQDNVANSDLGEGVRYRFFTLDAFAEHPLPYGSANIELAYMNLSLDDAQGLDLDEDPATPATSASRAQGDGFYLQGAYLLEGWQPWFGIERWISDAADHTGSFWIYRLGLTYFVDAHNLNFKAGYELFKSDQPLEAASSKSTIHSFVAGIFLSY